MDPENPANPPSSHSPGQPPDHGRDPGSPDDAPAPPPRVHMVPQGTGELGMFLFLAALTMLFAASLLGFIIIRLTSDNAPPMGVVHLPWPLWISTGVILLSSFTMHRALNNVQQERQTRFRNMMTITLGLAALFLLVQVPSMVSLVEGYLQRRDQFAHAQAAAALSVRVGQPGDFPPMPLQGLVFALILIHALHVLGGVIPLSVITAKAHHGRYDHESCGPVKYISMYWHFLDGVWILMFLILHVAR